MILVTAEQQQAIDHYAIHRLEIPSLLLMENAALRVIDRIDTKLRQSFAVFCGTGNNGADGLAIGRGLLALGKQVKFFIVGDPSHASPEFHTNRRILEHMNADIRFMNTLGDIEELSDQLQTVNTLIDCLFGVGLSREVKGMYAVVIEEINRSRIYTISIDMPSGLDATTGAICGCMVDANEIITLQFMKKGLYNNPNVHGEIHVVPIGIPPQAWESVLGMDRRR